MEIESVHGWMSNWVNEYERAHVCLCVCMSDWYVIVQNSTASSSYCMRVSPNTVTQKRNQIKQTTQTATMTKYIYIHWIQHWASLDNIIVACAWSCKFFFCFLNLFRFFYFFSGSREKKWWTLPSDIIVWFDREKKKKKK